MDRCQVDVSCRHLLPRHSWGGVVPNNCLCHMFTSHLSVGASLPRCADDRCACASWLDFAPFRNGHAVAVFASHNQAHRTICGHAASPAYIAPVCRVSVQPGPVVSSSSLLSAWDCPSEHGGSGRRAPELRLLLHHAAGGSSGVGTRRPHHS